MDVVDKVTDCYREDSEKVSVDAKIDATDAPFLNGASDLISAMTELDNVNAVFRQAAVEDELDSIAINSTEFEPILDLESAANGDKSDLAKSGASADPALMLGVGVREGPEGYYRWDSSPWTEVKKSALPSEESPLVFPIQDERDS